MPLKSEVKQTGKRAERIGTFLSWMLAVLRDRAVELVR